MFPRLLPLAAIILTALACSLAPGATTPTNPPTEATVGAIVRDPPTRTPVGTSAELPSGVQATPLQAVNAAVQSGGVANPTNRARVTANLSNPDCPMPDGWTTYTVQRGDSLFRIAQNYDSDVPTLQEANCIIEARYIEVGQVIAVPGDGEGVPAAEVAPTADTSSRILAAPGTVNLYYVLDEPDGRVGGIPSGCGNMLVPVSRTVYGADTPANRVKAALEALFENTSATVEGYGNPIRQSSLAVESVQIETGIARVALAGEITFAGTCEIPLVRGQIEQTVLDDEAVNQAFITINGVSLDEVFSQR
jgi:LysM repeat protein